MFYFVDDSWLNITPEQLDEMLQRAGQSATRPDNFDMNQIADSMKSFVENVSSYEGAEFPK